MKAAAPLGGKQQHKVNYPRIFESGNDSTLHVLYVAALSAFAVWLLGKGWNFSEADSLALVVFFVMSIAGAVIGGGEKRTPGPSSEGPVAAQHAIPEMPETVTAHIRGETHPTPSLETVIQTR